MTLRCALYARYSSDQQRAASIEDQFRICRELAEREGWKLTGTYKDSAVSGASVILRPGVQALLEDARRGPVRDRGRGSPRPGEPRPGRRGGALQASALRGRDDRHALGRRDQRASRRPQGHDERAVPEGPRGQDAPGPPGPGRGRQVGRRHLLRLRRGEAARRRRRADPGRAQHRRGRGGDRAAHLPGVRSGHQPARDRAASQRGRHPRPQGQALDRFRAARPRQAGNRAAQQRAVYRPAGVEPPALHEESGHRQAGSRASTRPRKWIVAEVPELRIVDDELWQAAKARQGGNLREIRHRHRGHAPRPMPTGSTAPTGPATCCRACWNAVCAAAPTPSAARTATAAPTTS